MTRGIGLGRCYCSQVSIQKSCQKCWDIHQSTSPSTSTATFCLICKQARRVPWNGSWEGDLWLVGVKLGVKTKIGSEVGCLGALIFLEPAVGLEPTTCGLRNRCPATYLRRRGIVREAAARRAGLRATRLSILRRRCPRQASATNEGKLTTSR